MLNDQHFSAASAIHRKMYISLTEVAELTDELSQAVSRQDQVAVRMFLSMRQEEIQRLTSYQAMLRRQCVQLPGEDGALLRQMLSGQFSGTPPSPAGEELLRQVQRNRVLLDRVQRADQAVSRRLGGKNSFYAKGGKPSSKP